MSAKQGRIISNACLKQGQSIRGQVAPPHPGIYRVPPPAEEKNLTKLYCDPRVTYDFQNLPNNSLCAFLSLENDTVALAGYGNVRLQRRLYNYAKAAHKPTAMTLRLVDELFSKETLLRSTVHGTKEFAPLDQEIIAAIKGIYIY